MVNFLLGFAAGFGTFVVLEAISIIRQMEEDKKNANKKQ